MSEKSNSYAAPTDERGYTLRATLFGDGLVELRVMGQLIVCSVEALLSVAAWMEGDDHTASD